MAEPLPVGDVRGVLRTATDGSWELRRWRPAPALAATVAWYWAVRWDRRGLPGHEQVTLPHPSAHLTVEDGVVTLHGPHRRPFARILAGAGQVVGARFRPGALRPFLGVPVSWIADRELPASIVPGVDVEGLAAAVEESVGLDAAVAVVEAALAPLAPVEPDPAAALATRAVALLDEDRSVTTVAVLADRLGLSVRSLHRLFNEHVGLGPAWVIRRLRLQEVAASAVGGGDVDWAGMAARLGYCDQAHLVRDFTATVGVPPARYAAAAR